MCYVIHFSLLKLHCKKLELYTNKRSVCDYLLMKNNEMYVNKIYIEKIHLESLINNELGCELLLNDDQNRYLLFLTEKGQNLLSKKGYSDLFYKYIKKKI